MQISGFFYKLQLYYGIKFSSCKLNKPREVKVNYTKSGQGQSKFFEFGRSVGGKENLQIVLEDKQTG